MLSCYRVLDLTDDKAFICGHALSDFGAEVIKIEKPGGDPARLKGSFYKDEVDPEKNLTWFAFNSNKKGITLDIETPQGKELFLKLVKRRNALPRLILTRLSISKAAAFTNFRSSGDGSSEGR